MEEMKGNFTSVTTLLSSCAGCNNRKTPMGDFGGPDLIRIMAPRYYVTATAITIRLTPLLISKGMVAAETQDFPYQTVTNPTKLIGGHEPYIFYFPPF